MKLYHICRKEEWESRQGDLWHPESYLEEGFIHLSFKGQIKDSLKRHFKDKDNLICLEVHIPANDTKLKLEFVSARNQKMPHYYGVIKSKWVKAIEKI